jgi:hypothetical protein
VHILFARVGYMKWYKNTKLGDQRPIAEAHTTSIGSGMTPITSRTSAAKYTDTFSLTCRSSTV